MVYGYTSQAASVSQASTQQPIQNQQYYGQPHTTKLSYVSPGQQAYVQPQQPRAGYVQEQAYTTQQWPQQQPQQQQQQFYR